MPLMKILNKRGIKKNNNSKEKRKIILKNNLRIQLSQTRKVSLLVKYHHVMTTAH